MILRLMLLTTLTLVSFTPIHGHAESNQVQDSNHAPLWMNTFKELFGITDPSGKVKTAKDKLSSVWFEHSFQNGDGNAHVIFTKTQELHDTGELIDCHACTAEIGAVTYKKVDDEWQVISKQQYIGEVGSNGDAPEVTIGEVGSYGDAPEYTHAEILQISPDKFVVLIEDGYDNMGYEVTGKDVFLFNKDKWQYLGVVVTGESNFGSSQCGEEHKCFSSEGKISVIAGEKEYPNLLVTKTGTEQNDKDKTVPAKKAIYIFNGKKYKQKP